jgi:hypothetical protein
VASGTTVSLLQLYTAETGFGRMESEVKLATNNTVITMWWVAAAEKQYHQVLAIVMTLLFFFQKGGPFVAKGFSLCWFLVLLFWVSFPPSPTKKVCQLP